MTLNIWSDFENLLANPDFNSLGEIFTDYVPDYLSDRDSVTAVLIATNPADTRIDL